MVWVWLRGCFFFQGIKGILVCFCFCLEELGGFVFAWRFCFCLGILGISIDQYHQCIVDCIDCD